MRRQLNGTRPLNVETLLAVTRVLGIGLRAEAGQGTSPEVTLPPGTLWALCSALYHRRNTARGRIMQVKDYRRLGLYALAIGAVAALLFVGWEHTHGGVESHHLLNRADLPAVSNWWGLLVLPVLGLVAGEVVKRRARGAASVIPRALMSALGAMLAGALLSLAFITGNESISGWILLGLFASGLLLPIYRAEYLFGFVLGMAPTFGAVLPTLVGLVVGAVSALFHLLLYRMVAKAYRHLRT